MPTVLNPTGAPSIFGGIGRLEWAPTNAPDDPFPTYVDITPYVRTEDTPLNITRGRQSELDTIQPSQLTCVLDNTDLRFTFGLTTGPYGTNWTAAKQVRYSETIGGRTFALFKGFIEFPDIDDWQPIGLQYVQLTCTDRLTRLGRGRPFVSTLGANIVSASPSLIAYYPLNDTVGSKTALPAVGSVRPVATVFPTLGAAPPLGIVFGTGDRPLGDDLSTCATWAWTGGLSSGYLNAPLNPTITIGATDQLVICAWVNPALLPVAVSSSDLTVISLNNSAVGGFASLHAVGGVPSSTIPGNWTASIVSPGSTWTGTVTGPQAPTGRWTMAAAAFRLAATQTLWVDDSTTTVAAAGSVPTSLTFDSIQIGTQFQGGICHVQIYVGDPALFTNATFLAQRQVGLTGLEYQTTGQRINTLLTYAGVPAFDRAIDPGQSFMQKASLAGQDPQTALQNAVTTERGRGFAAGDGRYVFHDRIRLLNL